MRSQVIYSVLVLFIILLIVHQKNSDLFSSITSLLSDDKEDFVSNLESNSNKSVAKVLILTQARSGSTFLGSLMSAGTRSFYIYEPFQQMRLRGASMHNLLERNDNRAINTARDTVNKILDCRLRLNNFRFNRDKSKTENCKDSTSRVIKTIRLRYASVKDWIRDSDIKVCNYGICYQCHALNSR